MTAKQTAHRIYDDGDGDDCDDDEDRSTNTLHRIKMHFIFVFRYFFFLFRRLFSYKIRNSASSSFFFFGHGKQAASLAHATPIPATPELRNRTHLFVCHTTDYRTYRTMKNSKHRVYIAHFISSKNIRQGHFKSILCQQKKPLKKTSRDEKKKKK